MWRVDQSPVASRQLSEGATVLCPGIEISAWQAHIVLLGDTLPGGSQSLQGTRWTAGAAWHQRLDLRRTVTRFPARVPAQSLGPARPAGMPPGWMALRSSTHRPRRMSSPGPRSSRVIDARAGPQSVRGRSQRQPRLGSHQHGVEPGPHRRKPGSLLRRAREAANRLHRGAGGRASPASAR